MKHYESPSIKVLGSVKDLTRGPSNKVGTNADQYTAETNGAVVGSIIPAP